MDDTGSRSANAHGGGRSFYRILLLLLIGIVCSADVLWVRTNVAPVRMYDDAIYLTDSIKLLTPLREGRLVTFLHDCLRASKGHPPMVKILPVPMYLILGTGTNAALYGYTVLIAVFCVYLFLLTEALFESDEIAFLTVAITVAFPLMYGMWRHVMAEFGTTVATTACLYHLVRSDGLMRRKHVVAAGIFFGWGLLWKISFPVFLVGPIVCLVFQRRSTISLRQIAMFSLPALAIAGPFYAIGGREVLRFARAAAEPGGVIDYWSLGPVLSLRTLVRYWVNHINSGISVYLFAGLVLLIGGYFSLRPARRISAAVWLFLAAWFVPPALFFSFQVLKEIRHLLPGYPALGMLMAALLVSLLESVAKPVRIAFLILASVFPAYQFLSQSFDVSYLPRKDISWGPFTLMMKDLERESLQLIPTYTYPANPVRWPIPELVSIIRANASGIRGRLPAVRVAGEHPYLSGMVVSYESYLLGTPMQSHGPFTHTDPRDWDFTIAVCGPEGRYGPLDRREPEWAPVLATFREIGRVPIPAGCDAVVYASPRSNP